MSIIARVILLQKGAVHIVLSNRKCVVCTPSALMDLLKDPIVFCETAFARYEYSTVYVNPKHVAVDEVLGLTLLSIDHETRITCEFPFLFGLLFDALSITADPTIDPPLYAQRITLSEELPDEKYYLMCLYMSLERSKTDGYTLQRRLPISDESQTAIMREIINTHFASLTVVPSVTPALAEDATSDIVNTAGEEIIDSGAAPNLLSVGPSGDQRDTVPSYYVSLREYANLHGYEYKNVHNWATKGNLCSAKKNKAGKWRVDPNDKVAKMRIARVDPTTAHRKPSRPKLDGSYASTQKYIDEHQIVTPDVRDFIRTVEEAKYYDRKRYREVCWDGFRALIIDIVPEYRSKRFGLTNRELIMQGKAPVVPNDEDHVFHLHHIGQQSDSPYAIIPGADHLALFSIFHQTSSGEDLHDSRHEMAKRAFWLNYLKHYDEAGGFSKIQHLNVLTDRVSIREYREKHG